MPEGLALEAPTLADVLAYVFAETDPEAVPELPPIPNRATRRARSSRELPPDHPAVILSTPRRTWERTTRTTPASAEPTGCDLAEDDSPETRRQAAAHQIAARRSAQALTMRTGADMLDVLLAILAEAAVLRQDTPQTPTTGPEREGAEPPSPPPEQLALVRSTLTAAPPQGTVSVPSPCCAVLPSKLAA